MMSTSNASDTEFVDAAKAPENSIERLQSIAEQLERKGINVSELSQTTPVHLEATATKEEAEQIQALLDQDKTTIPYRLITPSEVPALQSWPTQARNSTRTVFIVLSTGPSFTDDQRDQFRADYL